MSPSAPPRVGEPVTELEHPARRDRAEATAWSIVCRVLVRWGRLDRALRLLDLVPRSRRPTPTPPTLPSEQHFLRAGACLGRSLARSQYLRRRGIPNAIVLGVQAAPGGPAAHAWVEPIDDRGSYSVLAEFPR